MTKEEIFHEMDECLDCASISGFKEQVENLIRNFNDKETSIILAEYLLKKYSAFKAEGLASYMEVAIHRKPEIATVNHPENPLFKLSILRGSKNLYDCYMEEAIEPFFKYKNDVEKIEYLMNLIDIAEKLDEIIFAGYTRVLKGLQYSGGVQGEAPHLVILHKDDYDIIDETMEHYNEIIGRRDILKDLNRRVDEI